MKSLLLSTILSTCPFYELEPQDKILIVGDSLSGGLAMGLGSVLKGEPVILIDKHRVSSSIANPSFYDWPRQGRLFSEEYKPDLIFVQIGGNDRVGMAINGLVFGTDEWQEIYKQRFSVFLKGLKSGSPEARVFVVSLPPTKNPKHQNNGDLVDSLNQQVAYSLNIEFIDIEPMGLDYFDWVNRGWIARDGVHYTLRGAKAVGDYVCKFN